MPGIDPASFRTSALRNTQPVASPYTYSKLLPVSYTIQSHIFIIYITWRWGISNPSNWGSSDCASPFLPLLYCPEPVYHRNDNRSTAYEGCERNRLSIGFLILGQEHTIIWIIKISSFEPCAPIGKLTSLFSVGLYTCVIWSALNGKTIS